MPKLNLEDLARISDRMRGAMTLREGGNRGKIIVHMGTCGIAAGARKIMSALLDEMQQRGVSDIFVTTSGCAGLCSREPMVTVQLVDQPPVHYVDLTEDKIRRILTHHVLRGEVVHEYALARGSESTK